MICEQCLTHGLTSRVYSDGMFTTDMAYSPYWDENGVFHIHDFNRTTYRLRCSNGHEWSEVKTQKCPAGDFGD